jgi:hypothetical protein
MALLLFVACLIGGISFAFGGLHPIIELMVTIIAYPIGIYGAACFIGSIISD